MCGIYGIISKVDIDSKKVYKSSQAIRHRGPENHCCISDENFYFDFNRLAINGIT